jgi:hypothetical protein
MSRIFILLLSFVYISYSNVHAQTTLEYIYPQVTKGEKNLSMAFAGGINSAQYQTIDLDEDGDFDLVLFDRSSDRLTTFENTGTSYSYNVSLAYLFPDGLKNWMILKDYDCDGRKDLFTYTNLGIRVFKNTLIGGAIVWELVADPLLTQGTNSEINIFFNPSDIPAIEDQDGDGDLDIIVFDFSSRERLEYHKNFNVENTGECGFDFVRQTQEYGDIRDCNCDDFTVGVPCTAGGRALHIGAKVLLAIDYDQNGVMDIVVGQENCDNFNFSSNTGSADQTDYGVFQNDFPTFSEPLDFVSFPAAFLEDVTFDGKLDLLVSSNARTNLDGSIDFQNSSFVFPNTGSTAYSFGSSQLFLQDEMIDLGSYAHPVIADIDGDGRGDLILGNKGNIKNDEVVSSLVYYQSVGSNLELQNEDLFGLSSLSFSKIKPQFIDLNGDQKVDLFFSAVNSSGRGGLYYILGTSTGAIEINPTDIEQIDFLYFELDDFTIDDVDNDGNMDLLLGLSSGQLNFYRNTSSSLPPVFEIETEKYLGIEGSSDRSNLSLAIGDLDEDGKADLVTTDRSGVMVLYSDYKSALPNPVENLISMEGFNGGLKSRWGRISKPAYGQLFGRPSLAVGGIQGGVHLLASGDAVEESELVFKAYPNPLIIGQTMKFETNISGTILEFFTLSGQQVGRSLTLKAYQPVALELTEFRQGIYIAHAKLGDQHIAIKIIVSKS